MSNSEKYRVQTRYANPEAVVAFTGTTHKWVDSASFRTLNEAKKVVRPDQRVIKLCTPSEGALRVDGQGRRFNTYVDPQEVA